ncbi:MAG: NADH-quinone oxidoreductase subunit D [Actinomycetes bacterium]
METTQRIGLSPFDSLRSDIVLALPSHSPVSHGMFQIDVTSIDSQIIKATPLLGAMHRGAEKLFESRDYRQVIGLANRHEWLSAFSGEVGIAALIEREIGIDVPLSARWLRTLILEVNRISSHLAFLSGFPWQEVSIENELRQLREQWVNHMRSYTGSRMHPMLTQIGGMTHAPTVDWLEALIQLSEVTDEKLASLDLVIQNELTELKSVGKISAQQIDEFAVSGPVARASGVAIDLRTRSTSLMYSELSTFESILQTEGDVPARLQQLLDEILISTKLVIECVPQCITRNAESVNVLTPKVLRVPEGEYEHSIETPLGIASWFLVSKGDKYPYRLKLRPASLHSALALSVALVGEELAALPLIVTSIPFLTGDTDR